MIRDLVGRGATDDKGELDLKAITIDGIRDCGNRVGFHHHGVLDVDWEVVFGDEDDTETIRLISTDHVLLRSIQKPY